MRQDLYTKAVLTVIAVCLIALVFKNPQPVAAQNEGLRVVISGFDPNGLRTGIPVALGNQVVPVTLGAGASGGAVPVQITNGQVPVTIAGRIPVAMNVTQVAGRDISAAGVPVIASTPAK